MERQKRVAWVSVLLIVAVLLITLRIEAVQASSLRSPEAKWPTCTVSGLENGVIGDVDVDGRTYFVRRMATIFDEAIDDDGVNASGDTLQIFCVTTSADDQFGNIAMCLSGEACPWRSDQ